MAKHAANSMRTGHRRDMPPWQPGQVASIAPGYARYVGRVGALAVALGVGVAVATGQGWGLGVAWAETGTDPAGTQSDSIDNEPESVENPSGEPPAGPPAAGPAGPAGAPGVESNGPPSGQTIDNPSVPKMNLESSGGLVETRDDTGDDDTDVDDGADAGLPAEEGNEPSPSTPPLPAPPPEEISVPVNAPPPAPEAPPSIPAPQDNSNRALPTPSDTGPRTFIGQSTADMLDTPKRSVPPVGPIQSQSTMVIEDAPGVAGLHLAVASGPQSARTTALEVSQQDLMEPPDAAATVAKTIVAALLSPFLAPGPGTPVESPLLWAVLGWARRETQRTTVTTTPAVTPQETSLGVDDAGPVALMAAAAPAAAGPFGANIAPIAIPDFYSIAEDSGLTVAGRGVLGNDFDLEGSPLTATLVSGPKNGTVTFNPNGSFAYTPKANYSGVDTFTYRVSDGTASAVGTVLVTVNAVNDPPVPVADTYTTAKNAKLTVAAAAGVLKNDVDPDGPLKQAQLVSGPANGTLALNANGAFTYTPQANFQGTVTFTYRVSDGVATSAPTTVSITVGNPNTAPVARPDSYTVFESSALTVAGPGVLVNDTDAENQPLTAQLVTGPGNGLLNLNTNGSFTYTPNPGFSGDDSFSYRASDAAATSAPATVTIHVNDDPVARADSYTVFESSVLTVDAPGVLVNDTDAENETLTAQLASGPTNGTLQLNANGSFTYTPNPGFSGDDSFSYRAIAGPIGSPPAIVTIHVNDDPVARADSYTVFESSVLTVDAPGVLVNDTDAENETLTAQLASGPTNGTLQLNANGSFTYTPNPGFSGDDSFSYRAIAGPIGSPPAIVTIHVNDDPVARADSYTVFESSVLTVDAPGVLVNDTDAENETLTAQLASGPTNGTLQLNANGSFTYTPNPGFSGDDSFSYRAIAGPIGSPPAIVTIHVTAVNDAPTFTIQAGDVNDATGAITYAVTAADDGTPVNQLAVTVTQPADGTGTVTTPTYHPATGTYRFTYTPSQQERLDAYTTSAAEIDQFTLTVTDGSGLHRDALVTPTIDPAGLAITQTVTQTTNHPPYNSGIANGFSAVGDDGTLAYVTTAGLGTESNPYQSTLTVLRPDGTTWAVTKPGRFDEKRIVGVDGTAAFSTYTGAGTSADPYHSTLTVIHPDGTSHSADATGRIDHVRIGVDGTAAFSTYTGSNGSAETTLTVIRPDGAVHTATPQAGRFTGVLGDPTNSFDVFEVGPDGTTVLTTFRQNGQLTSLRLLRPDGTETTFQTNNLVGYNHAYIGADGTIALLIPTGSGTTADPYQSTITVIRPDGTTQSVTRPGRPESLGLQVGVEGHVAFISQTGTNTGNNSLPTTLTVIDPDRTVRAITVPSTAGHKHLQVGADGSAAFLATAPLSSSSRQTVLTVMYPNGTSHTATVTVPLVSGQGWGSLVAIGVDGTAAYADISGADSNLVTALDPDGTTRSTTVNINPIRIQVGADGTVAIAVRIRSDSTQSAALTVIHPDGTSTSSSLMTTDQNYERLSVGADGTAVMRSYESGKSLVVVTRPNHTTKTYLLPGAPLLDEPVEIDQNGTVKLPTVDFSNGNYIATVIHPDDTVENLTIPERFRGAVQNPDGTITVVSGALGPVSGTWTRSVISFADGPSNLRGAGNHAGR